MNKLSVFVPVDGRRDDVVAYFANNGVRYLSDMGSRISVGTVPVGVADTEVYLAADLVAESIAGDDGFTVVSDDGVAYELLDGDGSLLGYEAVFYIADFDD